MILNGDMIGISIFVFFLIFKLIFVILLRMLDSLLFISIVCGNYFRDIHMLLYNRKLIFHNSVSQCGTLSFVETTINHAIIASGEWKTGCILRSLQFYHDTNMENNSCYNQTLLNLQPH